MGIYFNPDNGSFKRTVRSPLYVDKTGLLEELNRVLWTESSCISLSHARRFGKSQAAGMIDAYYSFGSDSRELFSNFNISKEADFEEHLNKYNVIHMDISAFLDNHKGSIKDRIWNTIYREMSADIPGLIDITEPVSTVLMDAMLKTGRKFVIILDEWDCVIRNCAGNDEQAHSYLQFLHSLFKSEESKSYLALAYITGILPIKKVKDESALNNFCEYSMINSKRFTKFFGFTESEVKALCDQYKMDFESVKTWYDGYLISGMHMYNPNSVCMSMLEKEYSSYWKNTSAFSTINDFISLDYDGLKQDILRMLEGERVSVDVDTFSNDFSIIRSKNEALTALIHLGYLAYDAKRKVAYVPNFEVSMAFHSAISIGKWTEI